MIVKKKTIDNQEGIKIGHHINENKNIIETVNMKKNHIIKQNPKEKKVVEFLTEVKTKKAKIKKEINAHIKDGDNEGN